MVDMHSRLRDVYASRALALDVIILAGSVVFAAMTFADLDSLAELGFEPLFTQNALRFTSIGLFFASVAALRVDWKGVAQSHADAARRLAGLVAEYREARLPDGSWPEGNEHALHDRYSDVMNSIVPIPTRVFPRLKADYLRAKEVSRMVDANPGLPHWVAALKVRYRALRR
jgi:hypothetical protein